MSELSCNSDRLLDYADGMLSATERTVVDEHLQHCESCRRELTALQTSGARLTSYFAQLRTAPATVQRPRWLSVAQRAAAVAACLAAIALAYALTSKTTTPRHPIAANIGESPTAPAVLGDTEDLLAEIARAEQIARLQATIAILKDEPGMSERRAALERYLAEAYDVMPDLPAM
jgi:anti-sigma factor RsiW